MSEKPRFAVELSSHGLATLRNVVDAVKVMTDECRVDVSPDGWRIAAVDPAHVAMVLVTLDRRVFWKHQVSEFQMGLDLDKVKEALKHAQYENVRLSLADDGRLVVESGKLTKKIRLVDTAGMGNVKVPNLEDKLFAVASLWIDEIRRGLSASATVTDHTILTVTKDRFTMYSPGDGDDVTLRLPDGAGGLTILFPTTAPAEKARSVYPLDYLTNVLKTCPDGTKVTLRVGVDLPIQMEWDLAAPGDKTPVGHVTFMVAPRMDGDEIPDPDEPEETPRPPSPVPDEPEPNEPEPDDDPDEE